MDFSKEYSSSSPQTQWKSAEDIERLRQENRCFRCERLGCYARVCPLLPVGGIAHPRDVGRPREVALGPHGEPLRAKWKTAEQIEKLQMECRCFRCERQGCNTKSCPLLPAINPKFTKLRNNYLPITSICVSTDPSQTKNDMPRNERIWKKSCDSEENPPLESVTAISQESGMNTTPFLVNALINDISMVQALVDNGCLCSGIVDDELTTKLKLPRISIIPRSLETAEKATADKPVVKHITYVSLDLDGYVTPKLWLYVVPHSTHKLILGKKWLEDQDAVIHAKENRLDLRKSKGYVYSVKRWREEFRNVARPRVTSIETIASMVRSVPVCKASLEDISKALRPKLSLTEEEARERLPKQIRDFAHLFADDSGANELPPVRGNLDHAIN
ncbi:hypothetical protein K3495_g15296, partial [Podosphaera aphanis]